MNEKDANRSVDGSTAHGGETGAPQKQEKAITAGGSSREESPARKNVEFAGVKDDHDAAAQEAASQRSLQRKKSTKPQLQKRSTPKRGVEISHPQQQQQSSPSAATTATSPAGSARSLSTETASPALSGDPRSFSPPASDGGAVGAPREVGPAPSELATAAASADGGGGNESVVVTHHGVAAADRLKPPDDHEAAPAAVEANEESVTSATKLSCGIEKGSSSCGGGEEVADAAGCSAEGGRAEKLKGVEKSKSKLLLPPVRRSKSKKKQQQQNDAAQQSSLLLSSNQHSEGLSLTNSQEVHADGDPTDHSAASDGGSGGNNSRKKGSSSWQLFGSSKRGTSSKKDNHHPRHHESADHVSVSKKRDSMEEINLGTSAVDASAATGAMDGTLADDGQKTAGTSSDNTNSGGGKSSLSSAFKSLLRNSNGDFHYHHHHGGDKQDGAPPASEISSRNPRRRGAKKIGSLSTISVTTAEGVSENVDDFVPTARRRGSEEADGGGSGSVSERSPRSDAGGAGASAEEALVDVSLAGDSISGEEGLSEKKMGSSTKLPKWKLKTKKSKISKLSEATPDVSPSSSASASSPSSGKKHGMREFLKMPPKVPSGGKRVSPKSSGGLAPGDWLEDLSGKAYSKEWFADAMLEDTDSIERGSDYFEESTTPGGSRKSPKKPKLPGKLFASDSAHFAKLFKKHHSYKPWRHGTSEAAPDDLNRRSDISSLSSQISYSSAPPPSKIGFHKTAFKPSVSLQLKSKFRAAKGKQHPSASLSHGYNNFSKMHHGHHSSHLYPIRASSEEQLPSTSSTEFTSTSSAEFSGGAATNSGTQPGRSASFSEAAGHRNAQDETREMADLRARYGIKLPSSSSRAPPALKSALRLDNRLQRTAPAKLGEVDSGGVTVRDKVGQLASEVPGAATRRRASVAATGYDAIPSTESDAALPAVSMSLMNLPRFRVASEFRLSLAIPHRSTFGSGSTSKTTAANAAAVAENTYWPVAVFEDRQAKNGRSDVSLLTITPGAAKTVSPALWSAFTQTAGLPPPGTNEPLAAHTIVMLGNAIPSTAENPRTTSPRRFSRAFGGQSGIGSPSLCFGSAAWDGGVGHYDSLALKSPASRGPQRAQPSPRPLGFFGSFAGGSFQGDHCLGGLSKSSAKRGEIPCASQAADVAERLKKRERLFEAFLIVGVGADQLMKHGPLLDCSSPFRSSLSARRGSFADEDEHLAADSPNKTALHGAPSRSSFANSESSTLADWANSISNRSWFKASSHKGSGDITQQQQQRKTDSRGLPVPPQRNSSCIPGRRLRRPRKVYPEVLAVFPGARTAAMRPTVTQQSASRDQTFKRRRRRQSSSSSRRHVKVSASSTSDNQAAGARRTRRRSLTRLRRASVGITRFAHCPHNRQSPPGDAAWPPSLGGDSSWRGANGGGGASKSFEKANSGGMDTGKLINTAEGHRAGGQPPSSSGQIGGVAIESQHNRLPQREALLLTPQPTSPYLASTSAKIGDMQQEATDVSHHAAWDDADFVEILYARSELCERGVLRRRSFPRVSLRGRISRRLDLTYCGGAELPGHRAACPSSTDIEHMLEEVADPETWLPPVPAGRRCMFYDEYDSSSTCSDATSSTTIDEDGISNFESAEEVVSADGFSNQQASDGESGNTVQQQTPRGATVNEASSAGTEVAGASHWPSSRQTSGASSPKTPTSATGRFSGADEELEIKKKKKKKIRNATPLESSIGGFCFPEGPVNVEAVQPADFAASFLREEPSGDSTSASNANICSAHNSSQQPQPATPTLSERRHSSKVPTVGGSEQEARIAAATKLVAQQIMASGSPPPPSAENLFATPLPHQPRASTEKHNSTPRDQRAFVFTLNMAAMKPASKSEEYVDPTKLLYCCCYLSEEYVRVRRSSMLSNGRPPLHNSGTTASTAYYGSSTFLNRFNSMCSSANDEAGIQSGDLSVSNAVQSQTPLAASSIRSPCRRSADSTRVVSWSDQNDHSNDPRNRSSSEVPRGVAAVQEHSNSSRRGSNRRATIGVKATEGASVCSDADDEDDDRDVSGCHKVDITIRHASGEVPASKCPFNRRKLSQELPKKLPTSPIMLPLEDDRSANRRSMRSGSAGNDSISGAERLLTTQGHPRSNTMDSSIPLSHRDVTEEDSQWHVWKVPHVYCLVSKHAFFPFFFNIIDRIRVLRDRQFQQAFKQRSPSLSPFNSSLMVASPFASLRFPSSSPQSPSTPHCSASTTNLDVFLTGDDLAKRPTDKGNTNDSSSSRVPYLSSTGPTTAASGAHNSSEEPHPLFLPLGLESSFQRSAARIIMAIRRRLKLALPVPTPESHQGRRASHFRVSFAAPTDDSEGPSQGGAGSTVSRVGAQCTAERTRRASEGLPASSLHRQSLTPSVSRSPSGGDCPSMPGSGGRSMVNRTPAHASSTSSSAPSSAPSSSLSTTSPQVRQAASVARGTTLPPLRTLDSLAELLQSVPGPTCGEVLNRTSCTAVLGDSCCCDDCATYSTGLLYKVTRVCDTELPWARKAVSSRAAGLWNSTAWLSRDARLLLHRLHETPPPPVGCTLRYSLHPLNYTQRDLSTTIAAPGELVRGGGGARSAEHLQAGSTSSFASETCGVDASEVDAAGLPLIRDLIFHRDPLNEFRITSELFSAKGGTSPLPAPPSLPVSGALLQQAAPSRKNSRMQRFPSAFQGLWPFQSPSTITSRASPSFTSSHPHPLADDHTRNSRFSFRSSPDNRSHADSAPPAAQRPFPRDPIKFASDHHDSTTTTGSGVEPSECQPTHQHYNSSPPLTVSGTSAAQSFATATSSYKPSPRSMPSDTNSNHTKPNMLPPLLPTSPARAHHVPAAASFAPTADNLRPSYSLHTGLCTMSSVASLQSRATHIGAVVGGAAANHVAKPSGWMAPGGGDNEADEPGWEVWRGGGNDNRDAFTLLPRSISTAEIESETVAHYLREWTWLVTFSRLSIDALLFLLTAVFLEYKVAVVSSCLATRTAVVLSIPPLILPFRWLHAFLPSCPFSMGDALLEAPVPFITSFSRLPPEILRLADDSPSIRSSSGTANRSSPGPPRSPTAASPTRPSAQHTSDSTAAGSSRTSPPSPSGKSPVRDNTSGRSPHRGVKRGSTSSSGGQKASGANLSAGSSRPTSRKRGCFIRVLPSHFSDLCMLDVDSGVTWLSPALQKSKIYNAHNMRQKLQAIHMRAVSVYEALHEHATATTSAQQPQRSRTSPGSQLRDATSLPILLLPFTTTYKDANLPAAAASTDSRRPYAHPDGAQTPPCGSSSSSAVADTATAHSSVQSPSVAANAEQLQQESSPITHPSSSSSKPSTASMGVSSATDKASSSTSAGGKMTTASSSSSSKGHSFSRFYAKLFNASNNSSAATSSSSHHNRHKGIGPDAKSRRQLDDTSPTNDADLPSSTTNPSTAPHQGNLPNNNNNNDDEKVSPPQSADTSAKLPPLLPSHAAPPSAAQPPSSSPASAITHTTVGSPSDVPEPHTPGSGDTRGSRLRSKRRDIPPGADMAAGPFCASSWHVKLSVAVGEKVAANSESVARVVEKFIDEGHAEFERQSRTPVKTSSARDFGELSEPSPQSASSTGTRTETASGSVLGESPSVSGRRQERQKPTADMMLNFYVTGRHWEAFIAKRCPSATSDAVFLKKFFGTQMCQELLERRAR